MIETKLLSSLEKCFPDQRTADFSGLTSLSVLKNERFSVQFAARINSDTLPHRAWVKLKITGGLEGFASVRQVECLPSALPYFPGVYDDNYLRLTPGLYPDLLLPPGNDGFMPLVRDELRSYWITFDLDGSVFGIYELTFTMLDGAGTVLGEEKLSVKVINADLPPQKIKTTQWFHGDCLATYYNCAVFSEKWWKIVENYIKTAVHNGLNTILTPVFTSPLDTAIGHERLTVQLVGVSLCDGKYSFDYKKLDRWIRICRRCGIQYYEISHFFTQWGAAHAPKIMVNLNGETVKLFGWETEATGEEYSRFLRTFIPDFLSHMKAMKLDKNCLFHISDEPNTNVLEQYMKSRAVVSDLLRGYTVMDALSNIEFFENGAVETPIPSNNHIEPFIKAGVPGLWTYYCCGQCCDNVSNRLFSMPSCRNRAIGSQFFKYDIAGFLQWGFNFYSSQGSLSPVNPYLDTTGNYFVPSGDTFSVYPAQDGTAYESLRLAVFYDALQDLRAFELCASLIGKEKTVAGLESILGDIRFNNCARSAEPILAARELINGIIEKELS